MRIGLFIPNCMEAFESEVGIAALGVTVIKKERKTA